MEGTQADNIIAALDIGSSKITMAVAELTSENQINVIGFGKVPSHGISKGSVQDVELAVESIRHALDEASEISGQPITRVVAALTGKKLHCVNKVGKQVLSENEVTLDDVKKAARLALHFDPKSENTDPEVSSEDDRVVMHLIKGYTIDVDDTLISDPVGMAGNVLNAHAHLAIGSDSIAINLVKCIRKAGLDLDGLILQPWASAESCLTSTEKENGVIFLDFGAEGTDIVCYTKGRVEYTAVAPYGGAYFTKDISGVIGCSLDDAEEIKMTYGRVLPTSEDQYVQIHYADDVTQEDRTIHVGRLVDIMKSRAEEILNNIKEKYLAKDVWLKRAASGIVVSGGVVKIPGFVELIEQMWGLPVRVGKPTALVSSTVNLTDPEDATVMGVLMETVRRRKLAGKRSSMSGNSLMSWFKHVIFGDFAD